jgi:ribosomal protein S8E
MEVLKIETVDNTNDDSGDYVRITFLHMGEVIEITAEKDEDGLINDEPAIYIDEKESTEIGISYKRQREIFALANQIWKERKKDA